MGNWKCVKCGQTTWSANKPLVTGCVKGGNHRWSAYDGTGNEGAKLCQDERTALSAVLSSIDYKQEALFYAAYPAA
jgi:predicted  nucleic acid-binding Zn-ribbon protein